MQAKHRYWLPLLCAFCLGLFSCAPVGDGDGGDGDDDNNASNNDDNNDGTNNTNNGDNNASNNNTRPDLPPCQDNVDCQGGQVCRDNLCREACDEDDPCQGDLAVCDIEQGFCVSCTQDTDCGSDEVCRQESCVFFCRSDEACDDDEYCDDGGDCQAAECDSDDQCPGGFRCSSRVCISIDAQICEPGDGTCQGNTLARCNRDGTSILNEDCGDDVCTQDGSTASCVPQGGNNDDPICQPGQVTCEGNIIQACNQDGSSLTTEDCGDDICQNGTCIPVDDDCVVTQARARIDGNDPWRQNLTAEVLDTVILDGGTSIGAQTYQWSLLERPSGSTAILTPNGGEARNTLFLDLPGRYVAELSIMDEDGNPGCNSASVTITANPSEQLQLQVTWALDGTDLDLHLLHSNATAWGQSPWDCYWQNSSPEWGDAGNSDNPSLDIDDVDGLGPENITFPNPSDGTYNVGVYYYDDKNLGSTDAIVRAFYQGAYIFTSPMRSMNRTQFWNVARMEVEDNDIDFTLINTIHEGFPDIDAPPECTNDNDCANGEQCSVRGLCIPDTGPCNADNFEPNDIQDGAPLIEITNNTGLTLCPGDDDWYDVQEDILTFGISATITYSPANAAVRIDVYGPDGAVQLGQNGQNGSATATGVILLSSNFFVRVSTNGDETINYDLDIQNVTP